MCIFFEREKGEKRKGESAPSARANQSKRRQLLTAKRVILKSSTDSKRALLSISTPQEPY
jgi:hypothetical protein